MSQAPQDLESLAKQLESLQRKFALDDTGGDGEGAEGGKPGDFLSKDKEIANLKGELEMKNDECEDLLKRYGEVKDLLENVFKHQTESYEEHFKGLLHNFYTHQENRSELEMAKLNSMRERANALEMELTEARVRVKELETELEHSQAEGTSSGTVDLPRKEDKREIERLNTTVSALELTKKELEKEKKAMSLTIKDLQKRLDLTEKDAAGLRKRLLTVVEGNKFLEIANYITVSLQGESSRLSRMLNVAPPVPINLPKTTLNTPSSNNDASSVTSSNSSQASYSPLPGVNRNNYLTRPIQTPGNVGTGLDMLASATYSSSPMPEGKKSKRKASTSGSEGPSTTRKKVKNVNIPPPPTRLELIPLEDILWKPYFFGDDKSMCYYVIKQGERFVWRSHTQLKLIAPVPDRPMTGPRAKMPNLLGYAGGRYPARALDYMKT